MELFNKNGCLTDEAISAIINEQLDEMQSLEASEHLSFCDSCLIKYTNALDKLDDAELLVPQANIKQNVLSKIKARAAKIFFNRYVTVAAAASFAIIFTLTGFFTDFFGTNITYQQRAEQRSISAQQYNTATENTANAVKEFFSLSFLKGEQDNEKK